MFWCFNFLFGCSVVFLFPYAVFLSVCVSKARICLNYLVLCLSRVCCRTYAVRRVRDAFRDNKNVDDPKTVERLIEEGRQTLLLIQRQVTCAHTHTHTVPWVNQFNQYADEHLLTDCTPVYTHKHSKYTVKNTEEPTHTTHFQVHLRTHSLITVATPG